MFSIGDDIGGGGPPPFGALSEKKQIDDIQHSIINESSNNDNDLYYYGAIGISVSLFILVCVITIAYCYEKRRSSLLLKQIVAITELPVQQKVTEQGVETEPVPSIDITSTISD
eukprot:CAMPEP_0201595202 /NCGR_PEP_ID=MMETSP0190_2-20130828/192280_1 /ASSEMBLY_ACC=CAM_ASM_000263 /TAXON_ID=37353 /ORGANISM="Rosalina sp." /LENGTH=113 /DNA_ID=CAMNT_0048055099 /DNA_START=953 /DNA_END=1295 /DNA_ORIENTATION=+